MNATVPSSEPRVTRRTSMLMENTSSSGPIKTPVKLPRELRNLEDRPSTVRKPRVQKETVDRLPPVDVTSPSVAVTEKINRVRIDEVVTMIPHKKDEISIVKDEKPTRNLRDQIILSVLIVFALSFILRAMRPVGYVFPLPIEAFLSVAVIGVLHFFSGMTVEEDTTSQIVLSISLIFATVFLVRSMRPVGYAFPFPIEAFLSLAVFIVLHAFGGGKI